MMKRLLDILLSLRTVFGLFSLSAALCLVGSLMLPARLAFFSGIDDAPLFRWLVEAGNPGLTWWLHALVGVLALLALSTVVCTVVHTSQYLRSGLRGRALAARLAPQAMHVGVLFVMLGHLLTAAWGVRFDVKLSVGESLEIDPGVSVTLASVRSATDEAGYYNAWEAGLELTAPEAAPRSAVLRPVEPVYLDTGFVPTGVYFKSINPDRDRPGMGSALVRVCRDPGAVWALLGGVLVLGGGIAFVIARFATLSPEAS